MTHHPLSTFARFRLIEERLSRIERALELEPHEPPRAIEPAATPPSPHAPPAPIASEPEPVASSVPAAVPPPAAPIATGRPIDQTLDHGSAPKQARSLEQFIGGRLFAIAGAIIVVLGVAFFVKLARDNGWISLSPAARCLIAVVFGFALLGGAEFARRKINALTAIGLNIAGLATIYITTFVVLVRFDLIPVPLAFVFLALTGLLGVGISVRARYLSVAGLSLAAAYVAPIIFIESSAAHPALVVPYTLVLLLMALVISSSKTLRFTKLSTVAWWLHLPTAGAWAFFITVLEMQHAPIWSLVLIAGTWALTNAYLLLIAARASDDSSEESIAPSTPPPASAPRIWKNAISYNATFVVAIWSTLLGLMALDSWHGSLDWMVPAGLGVASLLIAQVFSGSLRSLRDTPHNDLERVAIAHITQAGALLLLTVALATAEWLTVTCWLVLGVAAMLTCRFANAKRLGVFGLVTLGIGLLHTNALNPWDPLLSTPHVELGGFFLTRGSLVLALNAIAWFIVAATARRVQNATVFTCIGTAILGASVVNTQTPAEWMSGAWIGLAALLGMSQLVLGRVPVSRIAMGVLAASVVPWMLAFLTGDGWQDSSAPIALHNGLLLSLVIIALGFVLAFAHNRMIPAEHQNARTLLVNIPAALAGFFLLSTTSLEVVRAAEIYASDEQTQRAALSIWWAVFAVPVLVIGFWKRSAAARTSALLLIVAAAIKALLYDLFQVEPAWRVVIFLGLGMLMLAIALIYGRITARASLAEASAGTPPDQDDPTSDR